MVLPECGIVLNRCIANRYSILVQPLLSMSRGICAPAISLVAAKVFSAPAKSPPVLATTKHRCTRYVPLSYRTPQEASTFRPPHIFCHSPKVVVIP